jgi:ribosomal protein S18 acetylase RimI-like enzyme
MQHDPRVLGRLFPSLREFVGAFADASPGGRAVDLDGVRLGIVPAMPDRSVVNSVVYDDAGALEAQLDRIAATYDDAGIAAWTVWAHEGDERAASVLADAGNVLDAAPMGQVRELDGIEPPGDDELEFTREPEPELVADLVSNVYGWPNARGAIARWWDGYHPYVAFAGGEPACTLAILDHDGDAHVTLVGTAAAARGRGLASALMRRALTDARERGCTTTTLVATAMGYPVYARLGYRDLGRVSMWERRRPAP